MSIGKTSIGVVLLSVIIAIVQTSVAVLIVLAVTGAPGTLTELLLISVLSFPILFVFNVIALGIIAGLFKKK